MPYPKKSATSRMIARDKSMQAKWKRVRFRDNRLPETKNAYLGNGCWCGEPQNHDWPGREQGVLHPNPREIHGLTPRQQEREMRIALQEAGVCPICRGYPTSEIKNESGVPHEMTDLFGEPPYCRTCLGTGIFPPPSSAAAERIRKEAK